MLTSIVNVVAHVDVDVVLPVVLSDDEQSKDKNVREIMQCYEELADAVIGGVFKIQLGAQMVQIEC
jgi:hypothetical protein